MGKYDHLYNTVRKGMIDDLKVNKADKESSAKKKKIAGRMKSKDKAYGVFDKMAEKKHPGLKFHKDFKENA